MKNRPSNETLVSSGVSFRWPWFALFVLTSVNLLNYIDRYIFSALLPAIKEELKYTDTELGILGSAFLLAYLLISPVFGYLGDRGRRSRWMAFGLAVWSGATALSGVFSSFFGQLLTRACVGLGESAYSVIAPSTLADYFPKTARGRVFAIYSGAIPVGSALGYVIGGALEPLLGWRNVFWVVGVPGLFMAVLLYIMRDPPRGQHDEIEPTYGELGGHVGGEKFLFKETYAKLFRNGGFVYSVLGYTAYTFVVGGMAFWMPMYIARYFEVPRGQGTVIFGAVTVLGGFIGTMLGGWWADWIERRSGNGYLKVCVWSVLIAAPLFWLALAATNFQSFILILFAMEVAIFLCISPVDAAVISYVRPSLRATAMALNVFVIHALGDAISRPLMGAVSDVSGLREAIILLPWFLILAAGLWFWGMVAYWQPLHWPKGALRIPKFQAHRGFHVSGAPENTIEAFRAAENSGARMFECDIRLSKDGEAVVFHDDDLSRMTGTPERVADLTAAELLQKANAPRLVDVLRDSRVPKLVNIEIKSGEVRGRSGIESAVAKAIREAGAENRVLISSFNPFCLRRMSKALPEVPRALLATDLKHPKNARYLRKLWLAWYARPHLLHLDEKMITRERLEGWRERGIPVVAWTVNDDARAEELLRMGVRSIISDRLVRDSSEA